MYLLSFVVTPYNTSIVADIIPVLPVGKYIVAVSGGVDSVVLLHLLAKNPELKGQNLIVAHFDHGIRSDSAKDELFVSGLARSYGLLYISERAELGAKASEATARAARYEFLRRSLMEHKADKIITAHHQDDLLETMILNVLRGTGRRGLDPLHSSEDILRPLLPYSKQEITDFATSHGLSWRDDPTNENQKYARNKVRHTMMPKIGDDREKLLGLNAAAKTYNAEINELLEELGGQLIDEQNALLRRRYVVLPHAVAAEFMHWWLTNSGVKDIDSSVVNRATIAAKTLVRNKKMNLGGGLSLYSGETSLKILPD